MSAVRARTLIAAALGLVLPTGALADDAAWYHPDDVASHSAVFQAAAEDLAPRYQDLESTLRRLGPPMEALELGASLAGDALPKDTRSYAADTRLAATAAHLKAQKHVDFVQEEYSRVFGEALQRALTTVGQGLDVRECGSGGGVAALVGRGRSCAGKDINVALAAALDQDARLKADVAAINALPWPTVDVPGAPQPVIPLTGQGGWVQLAPLAKAVWADRLQERADDLDRALAPLDDALEGGDPAALASAREERAAYDAALAADGQVLLALVGELLERKSSKGGADVGVCVNPPALQGCPGADRTDEIIALVAADRRLRKGLDALPK